MALGAAFGATAAAGDLNQKKLDEVYALAFRVASDTPDDPDRETPEAEAKRLEEIRTRPGITPYLFAILDVVYFKTPQDGFESILYAISLRRDLTSDEVAVLTDEMIKRLASPPARKYWWYDDFLASTAPLLAAHPAPGHEELAIRILQRPVEDIPFMRLRVNAAKALADMGCVRALPLIRETIERIKKKYGRNLESRFRVVSENWKPREPSWRLVRKRPLRDAASGLRVINATAKNDALLPIVLDGVRLTFVEREQEGDGTPKNRYGRDEDDPF
jgi:hypothetical protein